MRHFTSVQGMDRVRIAPLERTLSREDLHLHFSGGVSNVYDGTKRWRRHALTMDVQSPASIDVWVAAPPVQLLMDTEAIIAWGMNVVDAFAPRGYRPLLGENEIIALAESFPSLCEGRWIVPLGSFVIDSACDRSVTVLKSVGGSLALDSAPYDAEWREGDLFPLVPR